MARIRTVKPELFKHDGLFEAEAASGLPLRLAFIGLFCVADREGRFKWRPRALKVEVLPYDDGIDFSAVLVALTDAGFLVRYEVDGEAYGAIPSWAKHQVINNREANSLLPPPPDPSEQRVTHACPSRAAPVPHATTTPLQHAQGEGKGKEGNGREWKEGARRDASAAGRQVFAEHGVTDQAFDALLDRTRETTKEVITGVEAQSFVAEVAKVPGWTVAEAVEEIGPGLSCRYLPEFKARDLPPKPRIKPAASPADAGVSQLVKSAGRRSSAEEMCDEF